MKRILLKLSGEALSGDLGFGFSQESVINIANQVKEVVDMGNQVAIVCGGGNFWRGRTSDTIDRVKADSIGMMATVMNCTYVSEIFRYVGLETSIYTPFVCANFTKYYNKDDAMKDLESGKVVFFAGGTSHPYFSTDTATVLRAIEVECDEILLAKSIDGIYDSDPKKNPEAKKYDTITLDEVVDKRLQAMDLSASIMALENKMPFFVFDLKEENSILRALKGEIKGTHVIK